MVDTGASSSSPFDPSAVREPVATTTLTDVSRSVCRVSRPRRTDAASSPAVTRATARSRGGWYPGSPPGSSADHGTGGPCRPVTAFEFGAQGVVLATGPDEHDGAAGPGQMGLEQATGPAVDAGRRTRSAPPSRS